MERDPDVIEGTRRQRWIRRGLTARGRSLIITKAGWLFILLTLAVGFAAINSGSNLLHAVFGAQMALFLGTALLSEAVVRRVHATRTPASEMFARTPCVVKVVIRNTDPRVDVLSVSVEDDDRVTTRGTCGPVFAVQVPAGRSVVLDSRLVMPRRGRARLPPAVVATRFPFGLFVKMRDLPRPSEVIVYPHVHDVDIGTAAAALHGQDQVEHDHRRSQKAARSGEFFGLREYRDGDELRRIHWPASARHGRPIVREHEDEGLREVVLSLRRATAGEDQFEVEIERVASLALALLGRGDVAVGLRHGSELVLGPAAGPGQRQRILEFLALVGHEGAT